MLQIKPAFPGRDVKLIGEFLLNKDWMERNQSRKHERSHGKQVRIP